MLRSLVKLQVLTFCGWSSICLSPLAGFLEAYIKHINHCRNNIVLSVLFFTSPDQIAVMMASFKTMAQTLDFCETSSSFCKNDNTSTVFQPNTNVARLAWKQKQKQKTKENYTREPKQVHEQKYNQ
ncbi:hypothetical protein Ahia01_000860000 [Argonauta hians]